MTSTVPLPPSAAAPPEADGREGCPRCGAAMEWRHATMQCPRCRLKIGCCEGPTAECEAR